MMNKKYWVYIVCILIFQYAKTGSAISVFDVNKITRRSTRPVPRQLHISEAYLVEKDASGFQSLSMQKLSSIYAIIREWANPREFTIEYLNGSLCLFYFIFIFYFEK